jgi:hypothetical protein
MCSALCQVPYVSSFNRYYGPDSIQMTELTFTVQTSWSFMLWHLWRQLPQSRKLQLETLSLVACLSCLASLHYETSVKMTTICKSIS